MLRSQVSAPITNSVLAMAFIRANARAAYPKADGVFVSEFALSENRYVETFIVDHFMRTHPRGKGVKGNELLAQFYAACRTIKAAQSTPRQFRRRSDVKLNLTEQKILRTFTGPDHIITRKAGEIKGSTKFFDTLVEAGIISGYYTCNDRGCTLIEAWLTDFGIRVRADMIATQDAQAARQRRAAWFDDTGKFPPSRLLDYHIDRAETLRKDLERNPRYGGAAGHQQEISFHEQAVEYLRGVTGA